MKYTSLLVLFFAFEMNCFSQNFELKIIGSSTFENKVLDSLKYTVKHYNANDLNKEVNAMSEKLSKMGYIENKILENFKQNDSSYIAKISLNERIKFIHIYFKENTEINNAGLLGIKNGTLVLPYNEIETFLNYSLKKLEKKGFVLAKLKLINIKRKRNFLNAELQFTSGQQRKLNAVVTKFEENNNKSNFPAGHLKQVNRKYKNSIFNQETAQRISEDFEKFGFVSQLKSPEILFTKDTTKLYVYLQKRKSNTFDGYIGFANNENSKLVFNGYLDLVLENTIKAGEQFSIYWKSDGNNQKTFKASIEIPYIFKSPIGMKGTINIFKQDSVFQNTKTSIDLGYLIDYKTRIYLGYLSTESSDIQNKNNSNISDYTNTFLTTNLEYSKLDNTNATFPNKTNVSIVLGTGNRTTTDQEESGKSMKQTFININAMYNFQLNKKNYININYQNNFLKSDTYVINELYRFGGVKTIRGFAENSLQANFMTAISTEYRYVISPDLYLHSILDYGFYEDKSSNYKANLIGFGIGIGLRTNNGILKLNFTNGSNNGQKILYSNTIVTFSYNVAF